MSARLDGWTFPVIIRAHFAVDGLDCSENRMRVRAHRHFVRLGIDAIANFRTVAPQFFNKFYDLRDLLLRERCKFENHLSADIVKPVGVSLCHKDQNRHHQRRHGGGKFKPCERRRIKWTHPQERGGRVFNCPQDNRSAKQPEKEGPTRERCQPIEGALRLRCVLMVFGV